ncbi:AMP-binding protein [Paenibacillus sp. GYB006]|uniref:non-ribosomal peptide synthetase family protein n=1 Tax=Paenibacillus sp. GYB006 TaxID=2994394 RepID=UPI002F965E80
MVEHKGLPNVILHCQKLLKLSIEDRVGQFASISFDASVWNICLGLLTGSTLVLIPEKVIKDKPSFEDYIDKKKVSILMLPPSYLGHLSINNMITLRHVICGGEVSSTKLVQKWKNIYINAYGPTEATIMSTLWMADKEEDIQLSVPIGKSIDNTQLYILNNNLQLQPIGVPGELYISGVGVARGYLNRPELTAEKFVSNPFVPDERMYRTGDLARWLPDGNLEYLGRIDHQIKIRGYRIELGEIENVLLGHKQVKDTLVLAKYDPEGEAYLCGYVVTETPADIHEIKTYLEKQLPRYMVPAFIIPVVEMPLTANGKVDRNALPDPVVSNLGLDEYQAPETAFEIALTEIWQKVLGMEHIGVTQNFFDLGGNSLKVIDLISKVQTKLEINVQLQSIFIHPTIRSFSNYIQLQSDSRIQPLLLNKENEFSVFCFPPIIGDTTIFRNLTNHIDSHSFWGLDFIEDENRLDWYVDWIYEKQKTGPYKLLGYSAGGLLAYEVAKRLEEEGSSVTDVIILDTNPTTSDIYETDKELLKDANDQIEYFLSEQGYAEYFDEKLKKQYTEKVVNYLRYINKLETSKRIKANIHHISSVTSSLSKEKWASISDKCMFYQGYGTHNEMLSESNLYHNARLINSVLESCLKV